MLHSRRTKRRTKRRTQRRTKRRTQRQRRTQRRTQRGGVFEDIPPGATLFLRPTKDDYMAPPRLMTVEQAREYMEE